MGAQGLDIIQSCHSSSTLLILVTSLQLRMGVNLEQLRASLATKSYAANEQLLLQLKAQADAIHSQQLEMLKTAKQVAGVFILTVELASPESASNSVGNGDSSAGTNAGGPAVTLKVLSSWVSVEVVSTDTVAQVITKIKITKRCPELSGSSLWW